MNKTTLAYLAGIVDGEGSIMIRKSIWRISIDMKNPQYNGRIGVKNTNKEVIELLKKQFNGHMHKEKKIYPSKSGYRPNKVLYLYDAEHKLALNICKQLLPYLIIKKEQAKKIIELNQIRNKAKRDRAFGGSYKTEYINKFEKLYWEVKQLNGTTIRQNHLS